MANLNTCMRPRIPRDANGLGLSLHLVSLKCEDETEHEGFWPFVGEGIANDAMRLLAIVTQSRPDGEPTQCQTDVLDLGSNYEDNTTVLLNREVARFFLPANGSFPFITNVILLLIEEDYGGINWDEGVKEALTVAGDAAKTGVATATGAAVGSAIGSALGPIGTGIGAAVGALAGAITGGIADAIRSAESDIFPPLDLSMRIESPEARFEGVDPRRHIGYHRFTGHGGQYLLTYEWRIENIRPLGGGLAGMKNLYNWWNSTRLDNFLTSNPAWSGRVGDTEGGYRMFRVEGQVFDPRGAQPAGTIPLFSWWNGDRTDNFITSNPQWSMPLSDISWRGEHILEGPMRDNYRLYRLEGFIFDPKRPQPPNTRPLFSWWSADRKDNFATTQRSWGMPLADIRWRGEQIIGGPVRGGYHLYRLEGYVSI
ncbi:MAG: hypothetical protein H6645_04240 [Caldilineaceae bacterium]|nr:hypothetical protein [Caldilineaceae bacterium]